MALVTFCVGSYDTLVIKSFPTHFQVTCIPDPEFIDKRAMCPVVEVCTEVLEAFQTGIEHILHDLNYINTHHHFTFPCQARGCTGGHPAKLNCCRGSPSNMYCDTIKKRFSLPTNVHFWQSALEAVNKPQVEASFSSTSRLTEHDLSTLLCQLSKYSGNWFDIGIHLKFRYRELDDIKVRPCLIQDAPKSWLTAMLAKWLQWAPGDSRERTSFATLDDLKAALNKAGLGIAAHDLHV